jgi:hypothetical protein
MLPTLTAKDEYARIYAMTQAACVPILKFKKITGLTEFDHFVCDYEKHKVSFFINGEPFEDVMSAAETHTFKFIEETLGCTMPLDETNIAFIETLKNPFVGKIANDLGGAYYVEDAITDSKTTTKKKASKGSKTSKMTKKNRK